MSSSLEGQIREIVRQELERQLRPLEGRVNKLGPGHDRSAQQLRAREQVLAEVARQGGRVTVEEWHVIGHNAGYDLRGLGGFFRGKHPSVQWVNEGRSVGLADAGWRLLEDARPRGKATGELQLSRRPLRQWGGRPLSQYVQETRR